ncbi:MAG: hypothetical protein U9N36_00810 [Euryarchaeota archaeon]|nr:hypothetical protein [Euryarchaeota archaeon]
MYESENTKLERRNKYTQLLQKRCIDVRTLCQIVWMGAAETARLVKVHECRIDKCVNEFEVRF